MKLAIHFLILMTLGNAGANAEDLTPHARFIPPSKPPLCYEPKIETVKIRLTLAGQRHLDDFYMEMKLAHFEPGEMLQRFNAQNPYPVCNTNSTIEQINMASVMMPVIIIITIVMAVLVGLCCIFTFIKLHQEERTMQCLEETIANRKQLEPAAQQEIGGSTDTDFPVLDRKLEILTQWGRKLDRYFEERNINDLPPPSTSDLNLDNMTE